MEPIDTYEHEGITINVYPDWNPEHANPREGDQLTTMVCWHPDYILGDEQIRGDHGAVETVFESEHGNTTIVSMRHLERYLRIVRKAIHVCPLYLYDHSGISIRAGSPSPFDNPTVRRDEYGTGMGWDTSMVGFVYTTHERITELCGEGEPYHSDEWIAEQVSNDVEAYDQYLQGAVYGYVVAEDSADEEACWGFLGWDHEKSGLLDEAKAQAKLIADERARTRALPWLPTFGNPIWKTVST